MLAATIALVVATIGLTIVAIISANAAKKSADAANRSAGVLAKDFELRMRPWVSCVNMSPVDWFDLYDWNMSLKNFGTVPADKVVTSIRVEVDSYNPCTSGIPTGPLFPQQDIQHPLSFRNSAMDKALQAKPRMIQFEITIKYTFGAQKYENTQYFVSYVKDQTCTPMWPDASI